jgi:hypothetical protein
LLSSLTLFLISMIFLAFMFRPTISKPTETSIFDEPHRWVT